MRTRVTYAGPQTAGKLDVVGWDLQTGPVFGPRQVCLRDLHACRLSGCALAATNALLYTLASNIMQVSSHIYIASVCRVLGIGHCPVCMLQFSRTRDAYQYNVHPST